MYETSSTLVSISGISRVSLTVAEHPGRGRGVFAGTPIRKGELIERAPVIVVPEADRLTVDASSVGSYIFMWEHGTVGEDLYSQRGRAAVALGLASLVNHSEAANCAFIRHIEALALDVIALRDIAEGEELTFNYGMTLWFTPS
jgi:SET domain-containing protein